MTTVQAIRPSPIAGSWYPAEAKALRAQVSRFIENAQLPEIPGKVIGVIAPHAGYTYSGPTAGYSYRSVLGQSFDLVVIASPLHEYLPYPFITTAHEMYSTPLGNVPVQHDLLNELNTKFQQASDVRMVSISNDREHSLEIQLPFLQVALAAPFELLPLMVRETDPALLQKFGEALAQVISGKKVLLVASTDLSHFFTEDVAEQLDQHMLAQFAAFSPRGVLLAEEKNTGYACGAGAVASILWAAKGLEARQVTILHHSTSADSTQDTSQVVGYGAAAISL